MATLGTLATRLARKLQDTNNTAVSLIAVREAINQAVRFWKTRPWWFGEFKEDVVLTVGSRALTLSENTPLYLMESDGIVVSDADVLYPVSKVHGNLIDALDADLEGRPYLYTFRAGAYELYPAPDIAYTATVRGIKDYVDFATDGADDRSTNDLLTYAEDVIASWALSRLHGEERQDMDAMNMFAQLAQQDYVNITSLNNRKLSAGYNVSTSTLL